MPLIINPRQGTLSDTTVPTGFVGELLQSNVGSGSSVGMTSNVAANITNISLTPGHWNVSLLAGWTPAAATSVTRMLCEITTTSATVGFTAGAYADHNQPATVPTAGGFLHTSIPLYRIAVNANTTLYAVAYCLFTVSTLAVFGRLTAVRV